MKYICWLNIKKSVLWRVAKRLSYIEDARCLKVNDPVLEWILKGWGMRIWTALIFAPDGFNTMWLVCQWMQWQRGVVFVCILQTLTNKNRLTSTDVGVDWWWGGNSGPPLCKHPRCLGPAGLLSSSRAKCFGKQRTCNIACIRKLCWKCNVRKCDITF